MNESSYESSVEGIVRTPVSKASSMASPTPCRSPLSEQPTSANKSHLDADVLPDQVARLAAANSTLMRSLKRANEDLALLLSERDELSAALSAAEKELEGHQHSDKDVKGGIVELERQLQDIGEVTAGWMKSDRAWLRERQIFLRDNIAEINLMRQQMHNKLQVLSELGNDSSSHGDITRVDA